MPNTKNKDIANYQKMVWTAWCEANNALQEEKLIDPAELKQAKNSAWHLPQCLEPNAVMPYYYGLAVLLYYGGVAVAGKVTLKIAFQVRFAQFVCFGMRAVVRIRKVQPQLNKLIYIFTFCQFYRIVMEMLKLKARENDAAYIELSATPMGRPLYEKLGFKVRQSENVEMRYTLK